MKKRREMRMQMMIDYYLALSGTVEEHESILCANQKIDTPKRCTEYLRVEALLILTYFGGIIGRLMGCGRHIHIDGRLTTCRTRAAGTESKGEETTLFLLKRVRMRWQVRGGGVQVRDGGIRG